MKQIACIIVTYKNEETIGACLNSIVDDMSSRSFEIILIDNASGDKTLEKAKAAIGNSDNLRIIENRFNLGFARAVNQGITASESELLLILNPDTVIHSGFFDKMISFLDENENYSIVAPRHLSENGETVSSCRRFPSHLSLLSYMTGLSAVFPKSRIINSWKMGDFDHLSSMDVEQPMGACMLTRRADVDEIGLMDENFRMFFNDVDWCARFLKEKKKIFYLAEAVITHSGGHSVRKDRSRMILSSHLSFARYFFKYYSSPLWIIPNIIISVLLIITALVRYPLNYNREKN